MKILVVDGNSIANRAFYGIKLLTTKEGQYTNAIQGFMNILLKLKSDEKPDEIAIAFDLKAPTFRHKMYDGYKAQRKGMPEELASQMPILKELLSLLGYKQVTCEGFEADDILGTMAAVCAARGDECRLATGDRDSLQLVTPATQVLLATTGATVVMDEAAIMEKYGVTPKQLIDVKSLMGDASDNIPGVAGVGEKTALALIQQFGTLDGVYENIDDAAIKKGVREKLLRDKEQAYMSHTLAEIVKDAPIETAPGTYAMGEVHAQEAAALLAKLEMFRLTERLHLSDAEDTAQLSFTMPEKALPEKDVLPLPTISAANGTVYLYSDGEKAVCVQSDAVYDAAMGSDALLTLLTDDTIEKQCFDAKPFFRAALEKNAAAKNITFDAKLAAYLLNPAASGYALQTLAAEYGVVHEFSCAYKDAAVLCALCTLLREKCVENGMEALLADIELPLSEVLADMELRGVLVDKQGLTDFGSVMQKEIATQLAAIYEAVGYEFNVNSPKQLGKALFEDLKLPAGKKTKSGYSTNAETLEGLRGYSPVIENILAYRTVQKLNSTYVEGMLKVIDTDGRLRSTFNQTETRTGRISSSEPNLQNIPVRTELGSQMRKFFIAPQGKVLLDADYSQIELRILAHISDDDTMCEAFNSGADIHRSTAARVYGIKDEDVTPAQRSSAKAVNFGIVYGIGAFSLAKDIHVSVKEANAFINNYLDNFHGVRDYMKKAVDDARAKGYAATMYGRRRPLPELNAANHNIRALGERMAMNTPIQGTAADIIKLAMVRVYRRLRNEGLQAKLILQVHDELIVECPANEVEKATQILGEEMRGAATLRVPLDADVHSGDNWYNAKG